MATGDSCHCGNLDNNLPQSEEPDGALAHFATIGLDQLEEAALLKRLDTKFAFNDLNLADVLRGLDDSYYILQVDGRRQFTYENLYFDTEDYRMYLNHHNGKGNRHKLRYRRYADTGLCFFEIKSKSRGQVTSKTRLPKATIEPVINGGAEHTVARITGTGAEQFEPKLWVQFRRITLVRRDLRERITLDTGLEFHSATVCRPFPRLVVAEVKQRYLMRFSPFVQTMRKLGIQPLPLSKYCVGVVATQQPVKYNQFKSKLLTIEKLCNGSN